MERQGTRWAKRLSLRVGVRGEAGAKAGQADACNLDPAGPNIQMSWLVFLLFFFTHVLDLALSTSLGRESCWIIPC